MSKKTIFFDCDGVLVESLDQPKAHLGIPAIVKKLAKAHSLYVVASQDSEILSSALKKAELENFFLDIFGKEELGEVTNYHHFFLNPIDQLNRSEEEIIAVGDTVADIHSARRAGIPIIACSWGANSRDELIEERPEILADTS